MTPTTPVRSRYVFRRIAYDTTSERAINWDSATPVAVRADSEAAARELLLQYAPELQEPGYGYTFQLVWVDDPQLPQTAVEPTQEWMAYPRLSTQAWEGSCVRDYAAEQRDWEQQEKILRQGADHFMTLNGGLLSHGIRSRKPDEQ